MLTLADITFVHQEAVVEGDDWMVSGLTDQHYYIIKGPNWDTLGYVWREKCFCYFGTEGWNRGIRIRDYYPLEWKTGLAPFDAGGSRLSYKTRREATQRFLESL